MTSMKCWAHSPSASYFSFLLLILLKLFCSQSKENEEQKEDCKL